MSAGHHCFLAALVLGSGLIAAGAASAAVKRLLSASRSPPTSQFAPRRTTLPRGMKLP